jgi:hypothetical protein
MKQAYKIENKPVTPVERNGHGPTRYPFNKMKVGQSFWLEAGVQNTVRGASIGYGRRHNMKFSISKDGDGYRCGRIA